VTDRRSVALAGHTGDVATARRGLEAVDPGVRVVALGALERLGVLDDQTLAGVVDDPDASVRRRAVELAARHGGVELSPWLADTDASVVEMAAWACGERDSVPPNVLDTLIELAQRASDALVREAAVASLGAIGDDRGLDAILAATTDRPAIRRRAVLALAPFVDPDHPRATEVATALERAQSDRDWQVRQAAEDIHPSV
jgi:hypothetical protein